MTEIKPGPELDRAVAKAIGIEDTTIHTRTHAILITPREWDKLLGREHITCEDEVARIPFRPSTTIATAFAAAEKAAASKQGFGEWDMSTYIGRDEHGWSCQIGDATERSFEATPALAICAAILKLKEAGDIQPRGKT